MRCARSLGKGHFVILGSLTLLKTQNIHAAEPTQTAPEYYKNWTQINQYTSAETFESSGSFGTKLGIAYINTGIPQPTDAASNQVQLTDKIEDPQLPRTFTGISVSKGTSIPLDFGLTLALANQDHSTSQYGGHIQWTLIENFRSPTLGIRLSRIETRGLSDVKNIRTDCIQIGSSYAPLPYVTISGSLGVERNEWTLNDETQLNLSERQLEPDRTTHRMATLGIKIQPLTPFFTINFEKNYLVNFPSTQIIKLVILM